MNTPLRNLAPDRSGSLLHLSGSDGDYADGGEGRVMEILRNADDLSSMSDELESVARTWPERYHLAKSRGNIIRALELRPSHRVLEVGAGCGAVTRLLGERCDVVDAIEPALARAVVAAERTRDLASVFVAAAGIDDVPDEPFYDLVIVVGVLEYVGDGALELAPYREFLERARRRLSPNGHLVLAIENRLGVKYLAGSPEDHSGYPFQGIEGYQRKGPGRTFSRTELDALLRDSGFVPQFLHAFPDYKLARAVFADSLFETEASLGWLVPRFPSEDRSGPRPRGADEFTLWRSLIRSGVGAHFANSFVVISGLGAPPRIWPETRLGMFFTAERLAEFSTATEIRMRDDTVNFERHLMSAPVGRPQARSVRITVGDAAPYVAGEDLVSALESASEGVTRDLVSRWAALVSSLPSGGVDSVPANTLITPDGEMVLIDQEWIAKGWTPDQITARGAFWLGRALSERTPPERWPGCASVRDVIGMIGGYAGLEPAGGWIGQAVAREAQLQAEILGWDLQQETAWRDVTTTALDGLLLDAPFGRRDHDRLQMATDELEYMNRLVQRPGRLLWWKLLDRVAPLTSRRRSAYRRASRVLRRVKRRRAVPATGASSNSLDAD